MKILFLSILFLSYSLSINAQIVEPQTAFKTTKAVIMKRGKQTYFLMYIKGKEFLLSDKGYFYYYDLGVLKKLNFSLQLDSEEGETIEEIFYHEYKDNIILYCHGDSYAQPIWFIHSINILQKKRNWLHRHDVYNFMSEPIFFVPPNIGKILVGRFNIRLNLDNGKKMD